MKKNIFIGKKQISTAKLVILSVAALIVGSLASCSNEPDGENLYTFTGKTIEDYIEADSDLTAFHYILQRVELDKSLAAYGQYTCFAPTNAGIMWYIDSLYNDVNAPVEHNGMTSNSLEGLNDSLCNDIAKYHLATGERTIVEMAGEGTTINTMLGYPMSTSITGEGEFAGYTTLNGVSHIISGDNEAVNGIFHKVDNAIARDTRLLPDVLHSLDGYTIFYEALLRTGLCDSVLKSNKGITYTLGDKTDTDGSELFSPTTCKIGYTIFAESDAVMANNNINSFEDLVEYANSKYKDAANWYSYINETGNTVSTGNDYTNRFNCLNMFVAYHILYASMSKDQLVFEKRSNNKWNYNADVIKADVFDYYETMLPNTLIKIWEPNNTTTLYINRWKLNNTLTDERGTMGSDGMHPLQRSGVRIMNASRDTKDPAYNKSAYNGYIHPIANMLVYDANVPNGVLHERLRFDATTFLVEFINNGFRYNTMAEMSAMNAGGSGARIAFPVNYFDNVYCYNGEDTKVRYNVKGDYRAYQADAFQGWGQYDVAIKFPHVPTGMYELRLFYSPMNHGGFMQFYLGTSTNVQEMQVLGLPLDVRVPGADERIGWTDAGTEDDLGIATDKALRNRGYMRAPWSFRGHPDEYPEATTGSGNCRTDGTITLRKILTTQQFRQSEDYWFRFKNMISDDSELKWQLDFIELVPVDIINNDAYEEDWY